MNETQKSGYRLPVILLLVAVVAGLAYYVLKKNPEESPVETTASVSATIEARPPSEVETETTKVTKPEPAQPSVAVKTKTLNIPAAKDPTIPAATASTDPAVEAMMGVRKLGSDTAPIKVVEYSSLTCGHCASFHKTDFAKIKTDFIDTGKVQFIFKEFPLNKPAIDASKLLRCMSEDKFVPFQSMLFEEQNKWAYAPDYLAPLKQNAKLAGLSEGDVESCLGNKELENRIIGDMKAASDKFKIESTPTFIVNDGVKTIVGHQPMNVFVDTFNGILNGTTTPATTNTKE